MSNRELTLKDSSAQRKIDLLEQSLAKLPPAEMSVLHTHAPGIYCRHFFAKKGTVLTSKIHKTEHPFVLLEGKASVWDEENGYNLIEAPHFMITKPGTRRVLQVFEDMHCITFHATEKTDLKEIEKDVIENRDRTLAEDNLKERELK